MKYIKACALVVLCCVCFSGCGFRILKGTGIISSPKPQETESTTLGVEFESVSQGEYGGVEIEKPESQKGDDKLTSAGQAYNSVTEVYKMVAESVVEITTEIIQTSHGGLYITDGAGSGVVIEKSGIIVTNYHVIEGAHSVTVRLFDGSEYAASLIGYDKEGDLAVIKIDAEDKNLTVASLGCSADLEVGEDVVALGNPLGTLGGTLTTGIISAKERHIVVNGEKMVLLQTNAAINPGNSGGGLFNMAGQLIGIVNAKVSDEGIEGLGFAIPIDIAYKSVSDIIEYGYVRGVVDGGLTTIDVTSQNLHAAYMKYGITTTGVMILESKYTSELRLGDKVVSVNGVEVSTSDQLEIILKSYSIGDTIDIQIHRGNKNLTVQLTLREKVPDSLVFD